MQEESPAPLFSTYLGEQLTPASLPMLAPQLSKRDLQIIRAWLSDPLCHKTIKGLVHLQWPLAGITGNFAKQQRGINLLLQLQGMPNLSRWNYIFDIQETRYVMQIAGVLNRVKNLLVFNDPNLDDPHLQDKTPDDLCDKAIVMQSSTYQTVSRMAHYLRALEAIDKFKLDEIVLPRTYIIGIDEDLPAEVHDENSVIIQEKITDVTPVRDIVDQIAETITEKAVKQLLILAIYAGLWDLNANLLFDKATGRFAISDFEQPQCSNPRYFFHKREAHVIGNIRNGIYQVNGLLGKYPHLHSICEKFLSLSDEELRQIGSGELPELSTDKPITRI
jgi:hypothetical protein